VQAIFVFHHLRLFGANLEPYTDKAQSAFPRTVNTRGAAIKSESKFSFHERAREKNAPLAREEAPAEKYAPRCVLFVLTKIKQLTLLTPTYLYGNYFTDYNNVCYVQKEVPI
jgi:hypothetical protein